MKNEIEEGKNWRKVHSEFKIQNKNVGNKHVKEKQAKRAYRFGLVSVVEKKHQIN